MNGPAGAIAAPLLLACLLAAPPAAAEPLDRIPNPRTRDGTWVTDLTGTLSPETIARINTAVDEAERTTGVELAVVVIRSLDGQSVEEAAARLFELWGIGKRGRDNGLLFLWSTGDRQVRVEVGYGLEGVLPDGLVGEILDRYVIPRFRAREFDAGVVTGVNTLLRAANAEAVGVDAPGSGSYDEGWSVLSMVGVGGAGLASTVGSLVGYRRWRRYRRRRCPECRARMALMPDAEDDALLAEGQVAEERIGSVDYDVWQCPSCTHRLTLRYPKWLSSYAKCPQCGNRTKSSTETVISAATTSSSGSARVVETCAFCSFHHEFTKVLPRVSKSSSSSSGGGSSFGGGRSGGGGASRSY